MKATVALLDSLKIFRMPRKVFEDLTMKLDQLLLCQMQQPSGQSSLERTEVSVPVEHDYCRLCVSPAQIGKKLV
jgi:hypothetical protein